jgi:predicted glycogen debranching enzyme
MIAMQGLTLITGRFQDAKGILRTFAQYVKNGLIPNMFPDKGLEPLYNTVDASLWYFHSVDQYLKYTGHKKEYDFIGQEIYPKLCEIMENYQRGTSFSIYMDNDCLIHAGSGLDQVTWMDVRVGDRVMTPRHGKPVEINALWYNALKVMEGLTLRYKGEKDAEFYKNLSEKVQESFCLKFWNSSKNCLYDVVEEETGEGIRPNDQVRPSQIYAISLPHTMLGRDMEKAVVNTVFTHLYATYGLRSLSPEDKGYKGKYFGSLQERDEAYHQGTVWAFPLGAFITAYVKVHDYSRESILYAKALLETQEDHLRDGCIGQIAEIFDGNEPHVSRGCYGQARGVGEILRAYAEDVLWRQPGD